MITKQQELFEKFVNLFREVITLEQDLDQLVEDNIYSDDNLEGVDKKEVKEIRKIAEVYARDSASKIEDDIQKKKELLDKYNDFV